MQINYSNVIPFKGKLRQNLALGESVIKEFNNSFPHIKSSTFLSAKIYKLQQLNSINLKNIFDLHFYSKYRRRKKVIKSLTNLFCRYHYFVNKTSSVIDTLYASSTKEIIKKWEDVLRQNKNYANCVEINQMLALKLLDDFKNINFIKMNLYNKKSRKSDGSHFFILLGIKKGGNCKNPSTWGENAVIIDGWAKINMRAPDAMEYYKELFSYDKKCHILQYKSMDKYLKSWQI